MLHRPVESAAKQPLDAHWFIAYSDTSRIGVKTAFLFMNNAQHIPRDFLYRIRLLDVLDRITQISLSSKNMESVLSDVLDLVLEIFNADRAWFLYPCDPDAPSWHVPMERTRPEWPGLFKLSREMAMSRDVSEIYRELLGTNAVIQFGPHTGHPTPQFVVEQFSVKSQLHIALRPKIGKPWVFGLHHCASEVIHDDEDLQLFTAIAQRISDTLSIMISIRELKEKEMRSQGMTDSVIDNAAVLVVVLDKDGRIVRFNRACEKLSGYTNSEVAGKYPWNMVLPQEDADEVRRNAFEALANNPKALTGHYTNFWMNKNGERYLIEWSNSLLLDAMGNTEFMVSVGTDITQRKLAEAKVRQLTQLYAALSQCNQVILRCTSEMELFPKICRDAVNIGGLKMAWIGILDGTSKVVKPVASFGTGIEYLDGLEISIDANITIGLGPTGTAIRDNQPFWCQDFQHNPATATWHERGAKFGWGSSASLPLHLRGIVIGAFTLYADAMNAFDETAQNLLIEMAMEISFALDRFASEDERKQSEEALRVSEQHLRTIIETEPECVKVVARNGKLLDMNPAGLAMLEIDSVAEARQHDLLDFVLPEYHDAFRDLHQRVMSGETASLEFETMGLKGARRWLGTHAAPMRDANGVVSTLLGITRDITERKRSEERIQYLANFDALTGLPNRAQLDDHLKYALSIVKRSNGNLAVLFIDIDRFKDINDTLGHSVGDALLVKIAKRVQLVLREEDTASRLGGDEFILILPGCDAQGAALVAQKLLQAISEPSRIEQYDLAVTASIGIAIFPNDGVDLETLSISADTAMYRAKHEGRNGYRFFTSEMQARAIRNMQLLNALRHALELGQFQVYYQPQISIRDGRIIGVEALLRWQHPELGNVIPGEFIPVAEDSGLILTIGEWVLHTAVQQLKCWLDSGLTPMVMAVNLSVVQFRHPSLPDMVTRILNEVQLPSEYLELELTEGVAMNEPERAIAVMNNLHERGIRMSIDDFGTGYSSLNYLKKFKVYKLKIDRSFVRDIISDPEDKAIVAAIISMSKNLGLKTIAEGVETYEQLAFLNEHGCDEAQGYYYSEPLSSAQIEAFFLAPTCNSI